MHRKTETPALSEPLSLRQRLIFALLTPLIAILALSSFFDYRLAQKTANQAHDQSLADTVFDLEGHIRRKNSSLPIDLTEEAEAMLRSSTPDMIYFAVINAAGVIVAGDADLPRQPLSKSEKIEFWDGKYRGKAVRIASHYLEAGAQVFQVLVMETTEKRKQASKRILAAMILPNLAVVLATLLAVVLGVRKGLLPLQKVEEDIAARSASDLHEIELAGTPAEIRPMLRRLNELFSLLRESVAIQQRFIADAAHQLRTPLAGLQTQLDLATVEGAFASNQQRHQLIDEATTRIGHLLTQLLAYARTETSSPGKVQFEPVALERLVENSASVFLDAALAKNIDLGFEILPAETSGLPWMIQEALSNLIDNAIRYTPTNGVITVRSGKFGKQAFIEVEDSGPGIPPEHLADVFKRFYRIPGSPGNGCGLGLAIVHEIAELHGAKVELSTPENGGLCVRLLFS